MSRKRSWIGGAQRAASEGLRPKTQAGLGAGRGVQEIRPLRGNQGGKWVGEEIPRNPIREGLAKNEPEEKSEGEKTDMNVSVEADVGFGEVLAGSGVGRML